MTVWYTPWWFYRRSRWRGSPGGRRDTTPGPGGPRTYPCTWRSDGDRKLKKKCTNNEWKIKLQHLICRCFPIHVSTAQLWVNFYAFMHLFTLFESVFAATGLLVLIDRHVDTLTSHLSALVHVVMEAHYVFLRTQTIESIYKRDRAFVCG